MEARLSAKLDSILQFVGPKVATAVRFSFSSQKGESQMLSLPANMLTEKCFIIGTDASGTKGAQLGPGQTVSIKSADPATVDFGSPDAPPQADAEGVASILSALVVPKNPPAQLNVPITITLSVLNSDGSPADGTPLTDTITVTAPVAGVATSVGDLFENGVAAKGMRSAKK